MKKNFLALATELIKSLKGNSEIGSNPGNRPGKDEKRSFLPWRFLNPEGLKTKDVKGTIMTWCTNDCHPQPMWCGRKNCLNRADFAKKMQESQNKGGKFENNSVKENENGKNNNHSSEFKIALAAMCSEEDYQLLEKQFFSEN